MEAAAEAELGVENAAHRYQSLARSQGEQILEAAEQVVSARSLTCAKVHIQDSDPASGVIDAAENAKADLIVLASHGRRGLTELLLGSVANEVLTRSAVPVLVVR